MNWFLLLIVSELSTGIFGKDVFVLSQNPASDGGKGSMENPYNSVSYALSQMSENSTLYLASNTVPYYVSSVLFYDMTYIITIKTLD